jgi:hypothetical protein
MAVYKIFPSKDATIYSRYPNKNTGLDEILSVSIEDSQDSGNTQTSRILIQFSDTEISDIITNKINNAIWSASLKMYASVINGLNSTTTLEIYPISGSWNMGTGKYTYSPEYTNGVNWYSRSSSGSGNWPTSGFSSFVTASYSSTSGGGTWYTGSSNATVLPIYITQSFSFYDDKDINADVTNIVKAWLSGSISNNGFIIKQAVEFIDDLQYNNTMEYFSRDTHTIYPPQLEFKWNDFSFNTGSLTEINILPATIAIDNNPGNFYPDSVNRFRVNSRPEYPNRVFATASYFTQNYYLPTASYYAIKDLDTNEYVIDFDTQFTKLSVDPSGSYFDLYMNGLEPERYYTILVKTTIDGSTIVFNDNFNFKVING